MEDDRSVVLLERWRQGDQQAAEEIFNSYAGRLVALARSRLSVKLARRLDPEDVLQSAFRSFFGGAREGRYVLERAGDLWRLLVGITFHKLQGQVERHTAKKRGLDREKDAAASQSWHDLPIEKIARDPLPEEAAALTDELAALLEDLEPWQRQVVEMRLQGHSLEEITAETEHSDRSVRRVLELVRKRLARRWQEYEKT